MTCPPENFRFSAQSFVSLCKKSEIPNVLLGLLDAGNEGNGSVDDEHQIRINTNDGHDGLLDDLQTKQTVTQMMKVVMINSLTTPQTNGDANEEGVMINSLRTPQTNGDTNDEGSHDKLLDDLQTNGDTNNEGSHDKLLDDLQTNGDTNDEGSHDKLLDDPHTNGDTNDESSLEILLDEPQTNVDTNDEGVREACDVADGLLLNNDFMNLERLRLCLAEKENTLVYKELPEEKKKNF
ncbi:hypothetical protein PoB_003188000 [Plakobranchus ocellatus]|uniref:Uncharacterized protein n=1 Tax=Plakobranchus ocellatus TaxID=259542 RepID=A0AAV4ADF3_9GAST|nr:hypothetical protein PoB_003188000 [Plakobranchus ocellatus]